MCPSVAWLTFPRIVHPSQLNPRALEAFDGPYDLWEEAAKESLELLLDADNHPMILLDRLVLGVSCDIPWDVYGSGVPPPMYVDM